MAHALVTGGAGFIGSHLVGALLARGHRVRVLDDFATGRRENLAAFAGRFELCAGDVADPAAAAGAVQGVDWVLHQAALPSVQRSLEDPLTSHRANVTGTLALLVAARAAGVRRFVFASSSSVYGNAGRPPRREDDALAPESPYAVSKLAGEQYVLAFSRCYGTEGVALRYFNVFGPRQDPDGPYAAVIPRFIRAALRGEPVTIFGDGGQSRDFTYVDNVVDANLRACESSAAVGQAFNVAAGSRTSLLEVVAALGKILGGPIAAKHEPPRAGEVRHSQADVSRARALLGYEVGVSFEEGLRRTVASHQERQAPPHPSDAGA